jgi:hypothetical protein
MAQAIRELLCELDVPTQYESLASPMREAALNLLTLPNLTSLYNEQKDDEHPLLSSLGDGLEDSFTPIKRDSIRQLMIALSEDFIKPRYGHDFWARQLVHRNQAWFDRVPCVVLVPDLGFQAEASYLEAKLGAGSVLTVQLERKDTSFANDSRSYIKTANTITLVNHDAGTAANLAAILNVMRAMGWSIPKKG